MIDEREDAKRKIGQKMTDELEDTIKNLVNLIKMPSQGIDRIISRAVPQELAEPSRHLVRANIEFLKAISKFVDGGIEGLEKAEQTLREKESQRVVRRERVDIE